MFAATHPGDKEYKPAVQQANMMVPVKNIEGEEQKISFPQIANKKAGTKSIKLKAKSDSGMKVGYYVLQGPAELKGDKLLITSIPPRSRFPLKVTIVDWQYGRSSEPKLKSADPVEMSFYITK